MPRRQTETEETESHIYHLVLKRILSISCFSLSLEISYSSRNIKPIVSVCALVVKQNRSKNPTITNQSLRPNAFACHSLYLRTHSSSDNATVNRLLISSTSTGYTMRCVHPSHITPCGCCYCRCRLPSTSTSTSFIRIFFFFIHIFCFTFAACVL